MHPEQLSRRLAVFFATLSLAMLPPVAVAQSVATTAQALPESINGDLSFRNIAKVFGFTGAELTVFGAVGNSRQAGPETGFYDVIIVVAGPPESISARLRDGARGRAVEWTRFIDVPSYYAVSSTRPLAEIGDGKVHTMLGIGLENLQFRRSSESHTPMSDEQERDHRSAVIRHKQRLGMFKNDEFGVAFIGRETFRSNLSLPANILAGPYEAKFYLFREGILLSQYTTRANVEREGFAKTLYDYTNMYPLVSSISLFLGTLVGIASILKLTIGESFGLFRR